MGSFKIGYCSLLLPAEKHIAERCKGHLSGISLHKFARALIYGIDENLKTPIKVFNIINALNYPAFPSIVFHTEKWSHNGSSEDTHIGYINLIGIKYITQDINLYFALDKWIKENKNERFFLIAHDSYYPMMKAVRRIKKKYKSKVVICLISGDIPGKFGFKSQYNDSFRSRLKERMIEKVNEKNLRMARDFDCFVFQTKYMAEGYGVQDKPVKVLECTYTPPEHTVSNKAVDYKGKSNEKIVFYAGSLREEYGILHLIRAFKMIKEENYKLWIAGGGAGVSKIVEEMKTDNRIQYLGFITPQEVIDRQSVATILVSPRTSELSFTKYSFPSKTMECLASGKPYIAHRLACEPDEYRNYIIYPENESDAALSQTMFSVCELSEEERDQIGKKNMQFIMNEKNPTVMCGRIIDLAETMMEMKDC